MLGITPTRYGWQFLNPNHMKYNVTDQQIESLFKHIKHLEKELEEEMPQSHRDMLYANLNGFLSAVHLLDLDDQCNEFLENN